jgi:uncharacterized protein DUF4112
MSNPASRPRAETVVSTRESGELTRLRALARLLDSAVAIPGTRFRVGLDALIGLVPGIGDAISAIFSTFIIYRAARLGAPRSTLIRMLGNVGIDTIVGEIPLLGDLFDAGWKSNLRNLSLLEEHLQQPGAARTGSRRVLLLLTSALVLLIIVLIAVGVLVGNMVWELMK